MEKLASLFYRLASRLLTSRLMTFMLVVTVTWAFGFLLLTENPAWAVQGTLARGAYASNMGWTMANRRKQYEMACREKPVAGEVKEVFYYAPKKLAVCHVQKAGCTFWKRIFHFLSNGTDGRKVKSPFDIDRFQVHFPSENSLKTVQYSNEWFWSEEKSLINTFNKVLFVRDPYARLWSVYVDKFLLPDFWLEHGLTIVNQRRDKPRKDCADDITFQEFLTYALTFNFDPHWMPVHRICNPCEFQPQYVGKMETFSQDSLHVLRRAGLGHLVQGHQGHRQYMKDEVRMLTEYVFRLYETRPGLRKCLRHSDLVDRLWRAFVLNGFINGKLTFHRKKISAEIDSLRTRQASDEAVDLLLRAQDERPVLSAPEMRAHRRRVMAQHYKGTPPDLLNKLVEIFERDFALFGYDPKPADIFGTSH